MEFEQIIKRIDWLEKQQRKTSESAAPVEQRLSSIERDIAALAKQFKSLEKGLAEITATASRLNQFDEGFAKQRKDMNTALDDIEKKVQKREAETAKRHQAEIEKFQRPIDELRKAFDVSDIRKALKDKATEEIRVTQAIADVKSRVDEIATIREPLERGQKSIEEARRTDIKRIADLQGELAALRKRLDETRDKMHLNTDSLKIVENRMIELLASESDRKQAQAVFIEQQSLAHIERDRAWKDWNDRVDAFKKQASTLDTQVQAAEEPNALRMPISNSTKKWNAASTRSPKSSAWPMNVPARNGWPSRQKTRNAGPVTPSRRTNPSATCAPPCKPPSPTWTHWMNRFRPSRINSTRPPMPPNARCRN
jgi:chromosome segregation ATPase